ncbi:MAG: hypothetical protein G01um101466_589, partial [Parcubacteria group bacterium Gr01-1014_66]
EEDFGITPVGHPHIIAGDKTVTTKIREREFIFIGLNATDSAFSLPHAAAVVKQFAEDPQRIVIISIHWGDEYTLRANSRQRMIAHTLIDDGADLIIGHHPHVVQDIEQYRDAFIFYSLGNFVFDQYFSHATQEGLLVRFLFEKDFLSAALLPIDLAYSQPKEMPRDRAQKWLTQLAARSDPQLTAHIEKGILKKR